MISTGLGNLKGSRRVLVYVRQLADFLQSLDEDLVSQESETLEQDDDGLRTMPV